MSDRFISIEGISRRFPAPGGGTTTRDVIAEFFADFPGPVLFGLPSGHTTTPSLSFPLGVEMRVVATGSPRVVFAEAAAE